MVRKITCEVNSSKEEYEIIKINENGVHAKVIFRHI